MGETKKNSKATSILKNNPLTSIVKGNIGIIVVLIIMCVAVALATDKFLTTNNIISVLRQISINTYIALGMTLIHRLVSWIDSSHVGNPDRRIHS